MKSAFIGKIPMYFSKNFLKIGFFNLVNGMSALIKAWHKSVFNTNLLFEDADTNVTTFWLNLNLFSLCFDVFLCWVIKERCKQDTLFPQATQNITWPSLLKVSLGNSYKYWATFAFFVDGIFGNLTNTNSYKCTNERPKTTVF